MDEKLTKTGGGSQKIDFVDRFLEKMPPIHIKGYNYCGPNTNLESRLPCINELDCACKEHDIAYNESNNLESRCKSDKKLILKAIKRIFANDSRFGERIAALITSCLISIKMFLAKVEIYINKVRIYLTKKIKRNTNTKQNEEEKE